MVLKLSVTQMLFNAAFQFSNLFVNAYLFKENHDIQTVAYYNFYMYLFWGICFFFGFKACAVNTRIGQAVAGFAVMASVVLLLLDVKNAFWLGATMGTAGGFFWTSYLSIYRSLGKNTENAGMFARVSLMATLVTVFVPILFGHLVGGSGYIKGFMVLLVISMMMIALSFFMPSLKIQPVRLHRTIVQHKTFLFTNTIHGVYFSFINIAAGLLVFMSGKSEASMGSFATYYGIVTVFVTFIIAYLLPGRWQMKYIAGAAILYIFSSFLFFAQNDHTIIIYNFMLAFSLPLFINPVMGLNFSYINQGFTNGEEGLLVREMGLTIGRLLLFGYMILFGLDISSPQFIGFLVVMSCFPLGIFFIVRRWAKNA